MQLFWELTKKAIRRQLAYKWATVAGGITNLFFGLLRASVMVALYGSRTDVAGMSLSDAITYTGISQAVIGFLNMFSWFQIIQSVYTGEIAADLLKPVGYFKLWMAQDFGRSILEFFLRTIPLMVAYALFFGITIPESAMQWVALFIALLLGWIVSFAWRFLVNLSAFWIPNAVGIARFAFIFSWFLSGFVMPLRFFPEWFVRLCYLTPFPSTINTIVEIYLGLITGPEIIQALFIQLFWAAALIAAGQVVLGRGIRKLVIQGG